MGRDNPWLPLRIGWDGHALFEPSFDFSKIPRLVGKKSPTWARDARYIRIASLPYPTPARLPAHSTYHCCHSASRYALQQDWRVCVYLIHMDSWEVQAGAGRCRERFTLGPSQHTRALHMHTRTYYTETFTYYLAHTNRAMGRRIEKRRKRGSPGSVLTATFLSS